MCNLSMQRLFDRKPLAATTKESNLVLSSFQREEADLRQCINICVVITPGFNKQMCLFVYLRRWRKIFPIY